MKECSFFTDDRYPANRTACSTHGDRHPIDCAKEWAEEARRLQLQLDEAVSALEQIKKRFMDVLKERGMAAFNYVDGGRMKDIAVEALRRLSAK